MPLRLLAEDPLEDAIQKMRTVQKRIEAGDTGFQTRQLQQQVVTDLEKLIDQARQQQSQPNLSSKPSPSQQQSPKPSPQEKQEKPDDPAVSANTQQKQDENAKDSTNRLGKGADHQAKLARRRQTAKAVWGHLPPALQQELLNVFSEQYLPKYENLIHRYFQALAEQGHK